MSFQCSTIPFIFFVLTLFYRSPHRYPISRITEHVIACNFSVSSQFYRRLSVETAVNNLQGVFFANGDERSDDKEDSPDPMPQKEEPEPQESKAEEVQRQEEESPRPRSRIETYDELARFRDSSRPPDSHYPPGPGPGYRRSSAVCITSNIAVVLGTSLLTADWY